MVVAFCEFLSPTSCSHDFLKKIIIYFEFCPLLPLLLNIISHIPCGVVCRWWHSWNGGWLQLFIIVCKHINWLFVVHGVFMVIFLFSSLESTSFTIAIMFNNCVTPFIFHPWDWIVMWTLMTCPYTIIANIYVFSNICGCLMWIIIGIKGDFENIIVAMHLWGFSIIL